MDFSSQIAKLNELIPELYEFASIVEKAFIKEYWQVTWLYAFGIVLLGIAATLTGIPAIFIVIAVVGGIVWLIYDGPRRMQRIASIGFGLSSRDAEFWTKNGAVTEGFAIAIKNLSEDGIFIEIDHHYENYIDSKRVENSKLYDSRHEQIDDAIIRNILRTIVSNQQPKIEIRIGDKNKNYSEIWEVNRSKDYDFRKLRLLTKR